MSIEQSIISRDTTIRLSCRAGDYLMWCGFKSMFSPINNLYRLNDLWQLSDGDFITVTNREADLPSWFELHPLEVSGPLAYKMMDKIDKGYKPKETIDVPNLWRAHAGDRLVWVGKQRPGVPFDNGILSIFTFAEDAAVIGEPFKENNGLITFGGFDKKNQSEEDIMQCQNGWNAIIKLGMPRSVSASKKWTISA